MGPEQAARALARALEAESFAGHDPYDALSSRVIRAAALGRLGRGAAIQALKRLPVDIRPLVGVPALRHTKAIALLASAYSRLYRLGWGEAWGAQALALAAELESKAIDLGSGCGWGYDFDVQTRWGYYRRGQPNAVVTSFAVDALLDVEVAFGVPRSKLVRGASEYALSHLYRDGNAGGGFFAYYEGSDAAVHNASLLVAAFLVRSGDSRFRDAADSAFRYSLERQSPDGTWPYGEAPGLEWVDGFHTAYVLASLDTWHRCGSAEAEGPLRRGLDAYLRALVDPDGAARATISHRYPVDVHALATGINVLSRLADREGALPAARRMASWSIRHLRRTDGRFGFQVHRRWTNRIPYVRWGDAHMLLALAVHLGVA